MQYRKTSGVGAAGLLAFALSSVSLSASADEFIGYGQAGAPGSWALEAFPVFSHTGPNSNSIYSSFNPAYFTDTGFTGTHRDQFEFWINGSVGYANTHGAPGANGLGFAYPNLGIEYYYNVVVPDQPAGSPGYRTFWTSPTFTVVFPNGNTKNAGYGAGADQYSYGFNVDNYIQVGRVGITANPIELSYASRNLNATDVGNGQMDHLRGGLSVTLMDVAGGYQVRDDLFVGLHHAYSIYSLAGSDFAQEREGKIGPAFSYYGFAKYGIYISGNLNFDYYTSSNLKRSISVTAALVKYL